MTHTPRENVSRPPLPALPRIGRDKHKYAADAKAAEESNDHHAHEAAKVGLYVTLAMDPNLKWKDKLKYFRHAIDGHCHPPPFPEDDVWTFYDKLKKLVQEHSGREAIRLASAQDDFYAARLSMGQTRDAIEDEAEEFFMDLLVCPKDSPADQCPEHFNADDWMVLKMIRDQWI
jgi:hypothetical protein